MAKVPTGVTSNELWLLNNRNTVSVLTSQLVPSRGFDGWHWGNRVWMHCNDGFARETGLHLPENVPVPMRIVLYKEEGGWPKLKTAAKRKPAKPVKPKARAARRRTRT